MKRKKVTSLLALMMAGVLAAGMAGCGGSGNGDGIPGEPPAAVPLPEESGPSLSILWDADNTAGTVTLTAELADAEESVTAEIFLRLDEEELAARRAAWKAPAPRETAGWLGRYARLVSSANTGAVLK